VCDRNGEVPRKFAYRNPSGMLPLHTAYQKTIAYENFYPFISRHKQQVSVEQVTASKHSVKILAISFDFV